MAQIRFDGPGASLYRAICDCCGKEVDSHWGQLSKEGIPKEWHTMSIKYKPFGMDEYEVCSPECYGLTISVMLDKIALGNRLNTFGGVNGTIHGQMTNEFTKLLIEKLEGKL